MVILDDNISMAPPVRISREGEDRLGRIRNGSGQEKKNSEAMSREYMSQSKCAQESDYVCPDGGSEDNVPHGTSKRIAKVIDSGMEEDRGESLVNHFTCRRSGDGSISNIDATGTDRSHSLETTREAGDFTRQAKAIGYGGTMTPDENEEKRTGGWWWVFKYEGIHSVVFECETFRMNERFHYSNVLDHLTPTNPQ